MTDPTPTPTTVPATREEYFATAELVAEPATFLPLLVRRGLYLLALAGAAIAPVLAVTQPEYAAAIITGAGVLNAAAIGTALANPTR